MLFPAVHSLGREEFPFLCRSCPGLWLGIASVGTGKAAPALLLPLGSKHIPRAFPAQQDMFSSPGRIPAHALSILGCLLCSGWSTFMPVYTCKHTPGHCRAQIPGGKACQGRSFPHKTCAVTQWDHQPLGLVLLSAMICRIIVFNYPISSSYFAPRFSFLCSQTMTLY